MPPFVFIICLQLATATFSEKIADFCIILIHITTNWYRFAKNNVIVGTSFSTAFVFDLDFIHTIRFPGFVYYTEAVPHPAFAYIVASEDNLKDSQKQ